MPQTFGGFFESNGIPQGEVNIQTIPCLNGVCPIKVPAPGFALVFLTNAGLEESEPGVTQTFATTIEKQAYFTATLDPSVLATSNGRRRIQGHLGSTSHGQVLESAAGQIFVLPSVMILVMIVSGAWCLSW